MPADELGRGRLLGLIGLVVVTSVAGWRLLGTPPRLGGPVTVSPAAEYEPLMPYLTANSDSARFAPARDASETHAALARDPFASAPSQEPVRHADRLSIAPTVKREAVAWNVSAILITDSRRVAVINGELMTLGASLPGGSRVTAIERDHVVLTDATGVRRTLNVSDGTER
jgi:hypothetical protein